MQSRLSSLIEATINTLIGLLVSFVAWPVAAWLTGITYSTGQHVGVVAFFTVISVVRSYVVRRWFNHRIKLAAASAALAYRGLVTDE